jgi:RNA polymerase sigma factor (sigma-70 family)
LNEEAKVTAAQTEDNTHLAITATWRAESAKVIAHAARIVRDVGVAEELAQDAFLAALQRWPTDGIPHNPGAWLMTAAKHRALDWLRQIALHAKKHDELGTDLETRQAHVVPDFVDGLDAAREDHIGDDLLRLMFTACHPVLSLDARVALTLKLLGGLSTDEIARAFVLPESTLAQRIVRAKRTLTATKVPFEVPRAKELEGRVDAVLEVIYLIFNEGYSATEGDDLMRPAMIGEALRLGALLGGLMPSNSEVLGLLALMEIQASRTAARVDANGQPVLLMAQDRTHWDHAAIARGLAKLVQSEALSAAQSVMRGPYALQAALAACHARAATPEQTDWLHIVALYDALVQVAPSPVVDLNRAVAVGMAYGPSEGLALVETLAEDTALSQYPWLHSVRADLLAKLNRATEASVAFTLAASLTRNERERAHLLARAQALS